MLNVELFTLQSCETNKYLHCSYKLPHLWYSEIATVKKKKQKQKNPPKLRQLQFLIITAFKCP
jgi:hypothetical protein